MKKQIKSVVTLVCICAVVALMLAVTNYITAPIIEKNENAAANGALLEVLPDGKDFKAVDVSKYKLPATVTEAYSEAGGGYVIKLTTKGYASGLIIMCGISADGTVTGTKAVSSNETPNIGGAAMEKIKDLFIGKNKDNVGEVDTVADATKTTEAYREAIRDALNAAYIMGGGSVDIRTEEEMLAENLDTALPEGEGKFGKLFITEVIEGIDAIYAADNQSGFVCVIGEQFIGISADGKVKSEAEAATASHVEAQMAIIIASRSVDVDISAFENIPSAVTSVKKTVSGNYIIEIKGAGYGINGGNEYHPASGKYIEIRVSVTADGKIIDCKTLDQGETENLGDACADEKFYGQFDGRTESDYRDVDAISGATMTTNGYLKAIERVFETVKILEGGASDE